MSSVIQERSLLTERNLLLNQFLLDHQLTEENPLLRQFLLDHQDWWDQQQSELKEWLIQATRPNADPSLLLAAPVTDRVDLLEKAFSLFQKAQKRRE